jgi:hypothetical protein
MSTYHAIRQSYRPAYVRFLLIAESPPPGADVQSSRHFYRSEKVRRDDRLFTNTIKALYPEAVDKTEAELEQGKEQWLRRFQADGWYMIEALEESQEHEVTKRQRQDLIKEHIQSLIDRVRKLANKDTKIILIKSNVFEAAAEPLRQAGFTILNKELLDYPGHFNQRAYRNKLAHLAHGASD